MKRILVPAREHVERHRWKDYYQPSPENFDLDMHLQEAAFWLARAQDAGSDDGVSYGTVFGRGFDVSYPETTGYIIPTFLELSDYFEDSSWAERAFRAGEWEIAVQLPSGAVMGGKVNANPTPAMFNTGMVLLGWAALARQTRGEHFVRAARRASDWMLEMQEPDGNWIRGNSKFARGSATVYNVKAAWGLCAAGVAGGWDDAIAGALRNAEFCLTRQRTNGWFDDCCLNNPERPLLHTIAYSAQGLLGIGILTGRQHFIEAARKTADSVMRLMDREGFIPGRFDAEFRPAVDWCCLTGSAQISLVWAKLYELTRQEKYRSACIRVNRYLMARHDITNPNDAIRGGIPGSWPTSGDYGKHSILNWATNFFVESLLAQRRISQSFFRYGRRNFVSQERELLVSSRG